MRPFTQEEIAMRKNLHLLSDLVVEQGRVIVEMMLRIKVIEKAIRPLVKLEEPQ